MATLVCFHAHPDDESIATAGTMVKAAEDGHRVVLVVATRGEQGEPQPGVLDDGEPLWERRVVETHRAGEILGAERVEFLGYRDSGMMGEPTNDDPDCFWQADVEQAAEKLAALLREVGADILTIYDSHGGYGHPDHIQVHRVGRRAAELVGIGQVFQATMNRTHIQQLMQERTSEFEAALEEDDRDTVDDDFGTPEEEITHAIDVTAFIDRKRQAMQAHASQIGPDTFFLKMPAAAFRAAFGTEWYIALDEHRAPGAALRDHLFASRS
jgi:LmbE family N-acetylglucosaminyl deacetylase